jgi:dipeptidyl aminopeptidase/acylaminoacyl peptidase
MQRHSRESFPMALSAGTRLGPYEILEPLGAGGMGEVYRARDTKLGRDVALKVLPEEFARDKERLARFDREARSLAALNHPGIAAIHGTEESEGTRFLVLELVEGETLVEKLRRGPLPVGAALSLGAQIAETLESAHERGILHRDLKPSNISVTSEGKVKLLDFGLAKALRAEPPGPGVEDPLSLTPPTREGVILGTAPYMSPEQARGEELDRRSDIWSFGCVLYETLTGKRAFPGRTATDAIAAVLEREPDWNALPAATPGIARSLLRQCLRKDKARRLHDIADAGIEIEEALAAWGTPEHTAAAAIRPRAGWRGAMGWASAASLAVIGAIAAWGPWRASPPPPVARFAINVPASAPIAANDRPALAVSPDGRYLVYVGGRGEDTRLYLRPIDGTDAEPIPGSEGGSTPFVSPDGKWIAFFAGKRLKKLPLIGGAPVTIYDSMPPGIIVRGASWGPDGSILFADRWGNLLRGTASGGELVNVTRLDSSENERAHRWPEILPGGKAVIFTVVHGEGLEGARIVVQSLDTGERRTLIEGGAHARYAPTGHLVYARADTLMAAPFDLEGLEVTGPGVPILENVLTNLRSRVAQFVFSGDGSLFYVPGRWEEARRSLVWVDREGDVRPVTAMHRAFLGPALSPNRERLAVCVEGANRDLWVYEIPRGTLTRLTTDPAGDVHPVWTPDGERVAFSSLRSNIPSLYSTRADGSGVEEPLLPRSGHYGYLRKLEEDASAQLAFSMSPDGHTLVFVEDTRDATGMDLWLLPLGADGEAKPLLRTEFDETQPTLSPDGRWVAYVSNESGIWEVYVRPFPGAVGKWQVSTQGGTEPAWSANGRELFYRDGHKMMAVPVSTTPSFEPGTPRALFEAGFEHSPAMMFSRNYDVTPDGQRFVMIESLEQDVPIAHVNVVLNWFEELKAKMREAGE